MPSRNESLADLGEHLRAVNLTLIAVSVAVVFAAVFSRGPKIDKALTDVRDIVKAVQVWDGEWFDNYVNDVVKSASLGGQSDRLIPKEIKVGDIPNVVAERCAGDWALPKAGLPLTPIHSMHAIPRRSTTLDSFRSYWDSLYQSTEVLVPVSLSTKLLLRSLSSDKFELVQWYASREKRDGFGGLFEVRGFVCGAPSLLAPIQDSFGKNTLEYASRCAYTAVFSRASKGTSVPHLGFCSRVQVPFPLGLTQNVLIPVPAIVHLPINPQAKLQEHLASRNVRIDWRPGPFEYTFPELNNLMDEYKGHALPLDTIEAILSAQSMSSGESIKIGAVDLQLRAVRFGGSLIITALQLYLLLHLREFVKRISPDSKAWEVAWIGVYPGAFDRWIFALAAFALPAGVVLFLCVPMLKLKLSWINGWYFSFCVLATVVSLLSCNLARRLHQKRTGCHVSSVAKFE